MNFKVVLMINLCILSTGCSHARPDSEVSYSEIGTETENRFPETETALDTLEVEIIAPPILASESKDEPSEESPSATKIEPETESVIEDSSLNVIKYLKYGWVRSNHNRLVLLKINSAEGNTVRFDFRISGNSNDVSVDADILNCEGTVIGDRIEFVFTDTLGNEGFGSFILGDQEIKAQTTVTAIKSKQNYVLEVDLTLYMDGEIRVESSDDSYIFEDSDKRFLTEEELTALSTDQLRYARNEIYARYGRRFTDPDLKSYFFNKTWFMESISAEDFSEIESRLLNKYEKYNIELIKQAEKTNN